MVLKLQKLNSALYFGDEIGCVIKEEKLADKLNSEVEIIKTVAI